MRPWIELMEEDDSHAKHVKWISSSSYNSIVDSLFKSIRKSGDPENDLLIPAILTLATWIEAALNDCFIVAMWRKHGIRAYRSLAEALISMDLRKEYRLIVCIITDNAFQLNEDHSVVKQLDELISARNKIAHTKAFFETEEESDSKKAFVGRHPMHSLRLPECERFFSAWKQYEAKVLDQYDNGVVYGNDLVFQKGKPGKITRRRKRPSKYSQ